MPDESRTFGMEGMFRQFGIFSQVGQLYRPQDADQLMFYKEDKTGQMLQEGINEAGAMASWMAAATSYSTSNVAMVPFYIFYSMFGFQRVGDLAWAAGDMRARGFLLGGTSGRTTLNGEGLQHEDGHSHILSATIPNCVSYDPTFGYEVAVIIQHGLKRMLTDQEDVFFYLTLLNENYEHPPMPQGAEEGIVNGMYLLPRSPQSREPAQGPAARLGRNPSRSHRRGRVAGKRLGRVGRHLERHEFHRACARSARRRTLEFAASYGNSRRRHTLRESFLQSGDGPVIASTDYMKLFAEQIRAYVPGRYRVLGTDGFGRSDYRKALRSFFEVDRHFVTVAALKALADENKIPSSRSPKRSANTASIPKSQIPRTADQA